MFAQLVRRIAREGSTFMREVCIEQLARDGGCAFARPLDAVGRDPGDEEAPSGFPRVSRKLLTLPRRDGPNSAAWLPCPVGVWRGVGEEPARGDLLFGAAIRLRGSLEAFLAPPGSLAEKVAASCPPIATGPPSRGSRRQTAGNSPGAHPR